MTKLLCCLKFNQLSRTLLFGINKKNVIYSVEKRLSKYWHYTFVISLSMIVLSILILLDGYLRFMDIQPYAHSSNVIPFPHLLAGYYSAFFSIFVLPIPDYVLIPLYGYSCSVGIFNLVYVFLVGLAGAVMPLEYVVGRSAGRPLLLQVVDYVKIKKKDIEVAEKQLVVNRNFSIFTTAFIPYFYTVACIAAGTIKMRPGPFIIASTIGFAISYAFLEYVEYYGAYILTPNYDYTYRNMIFLVLTVAVSFNVIYGINTSVRGAHASKPT